MIGLLSDLPILLIVSFRPEFVPPWVGHPNATLITLNRLNRGDAERLATEVMIGRALPQALLDRIVTQSDGVPLFIEELTKSVLENAESYTGSPASLTVPETLQALLTARLDRLPAAKRVAQIGATIGREFSQSMLAAVAQMPEEQLVDGLDALVGSGLASRRSEPTDTIYAFKHALVQDAIYDGLLRRRRAEIHARIVDSGRERCIARRDRTRAAWISLRSGRPACQGRFLLPRLPAAAPPNARRWRRPEPTLSEGCNSPEICRMALIAIVWKPSC